MAAAVLEFAVPRSSRRRRCSASAVALVEAQGKPRIPSAHREGGRPARVARAGDRGRTGLSSDADAALPCIVATLEQSLAVQQQSLAVQQQTLVATSSTLDIARQTLDVTRQTQSHAASIDNNLGGQLPIGQTSLTPAG
jgi:hypothetical protein